LSLVTIASYREPYEAHLFRSLLESHEIPAYVIHEHHVGLNWLYSDAIGGVKLQVEAEDREAALEVLLSEAGPLSDPGQELDSDTADDSACPKCRSSSTLHTSTERRTKAISLGVGVPFVWGRDRWKCMDCGHQWRRRFYYRNPIYILAELAVLIFLGVLWVVRLPIRLFRELIGAANLLSERKFSCWNCGSDVLPSTGQCSECEIRLPDKSSFRNIIIAGKHYDAQCSRCHTPYAFEDYRSSDCDWRCSHCKGVLARP